MLAKKVNCWRLAHHVAERWVTANNGLLLNGERLRATKPFAPSAPPHNTYST